MRISEESEDDQMPDDWIDATLVCLLDPKMYRGNISDFVNGKDCHYGDPESHQKLRRSSY